VVKCLVKQVFYIKEIIQDGWSRTYCYSFPNLIPFVHNNSQLLTGMFQNFQSSLKEVPSLRVLRAEAPPATMCWSYCGPTLLRIAECRNLVDGFRCSTHSLHTQSLLVPFFARRKYSWFLLFHLCPLASLSLLLHRLHFRLHPPSLQARQSILAYLGQSRFSSGRSQPENTSTSPLYTKRLPCPDLRYEALSFRRRCHLYRISRRFAIYNEYG
jgi:hypothetical protein